MTIFNSDVMHLFTLVLIFNFKHFIADYLLQGRYCLGKFKDFPDFILPLSVHAGTHALLTIIIGIIYSIVIGKNPGIAIVGLANIDFMAHFVIDRIKADPYLLGRYEALSKNEMKAILEIEKKLKTIELHNATQSKLKSNRNYWITLGIDQLCHHITDLIICLGLICL